jgi:ribosome silencing factor RsfS/YbeB/iojap
MDVNVSPPTSSREKALELLKIGISKKAFNPVLIKLDKLTSLTDYFLIVSGTSAKHVKAIAESIKDGSKSIGIIADSSEGLSLGNWALLDYGDVIVHVFQKQSRDFYDLEGLWREAPKISIPPDLLKEVESAPEDEDDYSWDE